MSTRRLHLGSRRVCVAPRHRLKSGHSAFLSLITPRPLNPRSALPATHHASLVGPAGLEPATIGLWGGISPLASAHSRLNAGFDARGRWLGLVAVCYYALLLFASAPLLLLKLLYRRFADAVFPALESVRTRPDPFSFSHSRTVSTCSVIDAPSGMPSIMMRAEQRCRCRSAADAIFLGPRAPTCSLRLARVVGVTNFDPSQSGRSFCAISERPVHPIDPLCV